MATTNTEIGVDAGAKAPFPPFQTETYPSQLLWLAISLGLFYYLMSRIALPRISGILETRSNRIAQDLEEANRLKNESDEAIAAYEQDLADARKRAHGIAQQARDVAKTELDSKRSAVEADMAEKVAAAETSINAVREKAMAEVSTIAEDTAKAMVEHILGKTVTDAEVARAVAQARAA